MNPFEFVIVIILIVTVGRIARARMGNRNGGFDRFGAFGPRGRFGNDDDEDRGSNETLRLKEEVRSLKDRIQTLERIAVDKENTLANEIDRLRDR